MLAMMANSYVRSADGNSQIYIPGGRHGDEKGEGEKCAVQYAKYR